MLSPINKACNAHPRRRANLAASGLGCCLQPCSNCLRLYPVRLRTYRPAQPARALFLSLPASLPTFVTYLCLYPCPPWRHREGTKLRLSKCQQSKNRKANLRKLIRHPPRLTPNHVFSLLLFHLFEHYNRGTGERNQVVRGCERRTHK